MAKYKVTQKTLGWGFMSSRTQTTIIEEHINEHAAKGWEMMQAHKSHWEIPATCWRFIWKLPNDQES